MEFKTGGDLVKQVRKILSITQQELGLNKINNNTISRIENNTESISYSLAIRLCENISYISSEKGIQVNISALDLLETEENKCEKWCVNEVNNINLSNHIEKNIERCNAIIELSHMYKLESIATQAKEMSAGFLYKLSRFQEAFTLYRQCIEFYQDNNDLLKIIEINYKIGTCLYTIDFEESYSYLYKAYVLLKSMDKSPDCISLTVKVVYCIALYYAKKEDFDNAKQYLDSIINLHFEDDAIKLKISILQGNILLRQNSHREALDILEKLINLDKELIAPYEYIIYNNIGVCLNYLGEYESSINYLTKAINLQLDKNLPDLTNSLIHTGKVHINVSQDDIAIRFVEAALGNAMKYQQANYIFECNELLYSIYRRKNQLDDCFSIVERCKQTSEDYNLNKDFNYRYCVMKVDYFITINDLKSAKALLDNIIDRKEIH